MTFCPEIIADFFGKIFLFDKAHPLLFTQFYFWAFFAFVFAFFCLFKNKVLLRNTYLFFVSLFFYYKTSGLFTLILIFITIYNFFAGKWLHTRKKEASRNFVLALSVIVNLSILFYFKYAYFIVDVLNSLTGLEFRVFDIFWATKSRATTVSTSMSSCCLWASRFIPSRPSATSWTSIASASIQSRTSWTSASMSASSRSWWQVPS